MAKRKNRLKKAYFAIFFAFILIFAGFYFYIENQRNVEIDQYKKILFEAFVCRYECPLIEKIIMNKTEIVSETNCIKNCSILVSDKKWDKVSEEEVNKDGLFDEIIKVIAECKVFAYQNITGKINVTLYSPCVVSGLNSIKTNYTYLL